MPIQMEKQSVYILELILIQTILMGIKFNKVATEIL